MGGLTSDVVKHQTGSLRMGFVRLIFECPALVRLNAFSREIQQSLECVRREVWGKNLRRTWRTMGMPETDPKTENMYRGASESIRYKCDES